MSSAADSNSSSSSSSAPPPVAVPFPSPQLLAILQNYENALLLLCECVMLSLNGFILFSAHRPRPRRIAVSAMMRLFLVLHFLCTLSSVPSTANKLFRVLDPGQHLQLLFWLYALNANYYQSVSSSFVLFLSIDRILALKLPLLDKRIRKLLVPVSLAFAGSLYSLSFAFFVAELPLNPKSALSCAPLVCIAPKYKFVPQKAISLTCGYLAVVCNVFFLHSLNRDSRIKIVKNRVVKFTIFCEILCNIVPSNIDYFFTLTTRKNLSQYIGTVSSTLVALDTALCSVYYTWIFFKVAKRVAPGANQNTFPGHPAAISPPERSLQMQKKE